MVRQRRSQRGRLCSFFFFALVIGSTGPLAGAEQTIQRTRPQSVGGLEVTDTQFREVIQNLFNFFNPIVLSHGANLEIQSYWLENDFRSATKVLHDQITPTWYVGVWGGLVRQTEINQEALTLVLCHELGHHLGGFPFAVSSEEVSVEGEADYFATQACARAFWSSAVLENAKFRDNIDPSAAAKCDDVWATTDEQNLCYRIADASIHLARAIAVHQNEKAMPRVDSPTGYLAPVTEVITSSSTQCRLDTFMAGALCRKNFNFQIIPGAKAYIGKNKGEVEEQALENSCSAQIPSEAVGARPRCWFKASPESFRPKAVASLGAAQSQTMFSHAP